jgi:hypothetical protein
VLIVASAGVEEEYQRHAPSAAEFIGPVGEQFAGRWAFPQGRQGEAGVQDGGDVLLDAAVVPEHLYYSCGSC